MIHISLYASLDFVYLSQCGTQFDLLVEYSLWWRGDGAAATRCSRLAEWVALRPAGCGCVGKRRRRTVQFFTHDSSSSAWTPRAGSAHSTHLRNSSSSVLLDCASAICPQLKSTVRFLGCACAAGKWWNYTHKINLFRFTWIKFTFVCFNVLLVLN